MNAGHWLGALADGLWVSSLAILAGAALFGALRVSARIRYRLAWLGLAACLLAPFVVQRIAPMPTVRTRMATPTAPIADGHATGPLSTIAPSAGGIEAAPVPGPNATLARVRTVVRPEGRAAAFTVAPGRWAELVLGGIAGVALMGLIRLGLSLLRIRRLKRTATAVNDDGDQWKIALAAAETTRPATLLATDRVESPVAVGFFRPAVLIPRALADLLSTAQRRHVLLHEAVHLGRRDDWALLAQRTLEAVLWFHPAARWLGARLDLDRELLCDQAVARRANRHDYAETLIRLATMAGRTPLTAAGVLSAPSRLGRRIEALLGKQTSRGPRRIVLLAVAPAALALASTTTPVRILPAIVRTVEAGLSPSDLAMRGETLDRILTRWADSGFSGTVMVVKRGTVVLEKGYGLADRERGTPATANTQYALAGFTKSFTAAAILKLAEGKQLTLDDPVGKYLPELTGSKASVTIDQLLTYRDGMTRPAAPIFRTDQGAFLTALDRTPSAFAPGAGYRYNDFGHSLLGIVIERVTGMPYEQYIRSRFLEPLSLGMRFESDAGAIATEYQGDEDDQTAIGRRGYVWGRRGSLGLVGTAAMAHGWLEALDRGTVITPWMRSQLLAERGPTDYQATQTYGWDWTTRGDDRVLRRVAGTPGFEGELLRDESHGWSAVILVNSRLGWRFRVWSLIERTMAE